ncbi:MAG: DUF5655 domain-containing protein [Isosphaeraceae bacterium]
MGRTKRVATQKRVAPFYSVHPSVAMMQAWTAGLHQKMGRMLDEWIDLVQEEEPATTSRIDLGFALDSMKAAGRLVETGGFEKKDRITHRIPIESLSGVDAEVKKWLKYAYNLDA